MTRSRKLNDGEIYERARRAEQFLELATLNFDSASPSARAASTGNAVLAGIAAIDVICSVELGYHSWADNHDEALVLLKEATPQEKAIHTAFKRLLAKKTASHYGAGQVTTRDAFQSIENAEKLVLRMREIVDLKSTDTP